MTKEEFETVGGFGTVLYINGKDEIHVNTKESDYVTWFDSDEFYHKTHYENLFFEMSDFEKLIDKLARKYVWNKFRDKLKYGSQYWFVYEAYKDGCREIFEKSNYE